jgi:Double zinc ribbon
MTETSPANSNPCPNCGEPASGRFCSNCGMPLGGIACGACGAELASGAKFCHKCGTPVALPGAAEGLAAGVGGSAGAVSAGPPGRSGGDVLPWAVAGVAFVALIAMFAGQRLAGGSSTAGAQGAPAASGSSVEMPTGPAPDISQMTPQEQASRLYDRIMSAFEAGHMDTVQMFAPMAIGAYQNLGASMTLDERYDLGRVAEVTGAYPLAAAEADTILREHPNHLLGLILAAQAAHSQNQATAEKKYLDRLVKAAPAEQRKNLPEYQQHENDIKAALAQARKG